MRVLSSVLLLALSTASLAQETESLSEDVAFLELISVRETYYVGQPIRLRFQIGYDEEFFRKSGIALFRQRLDISFKLDAPWWEELPSALLLQNRNPEGSNETPRTFVLNDGVARALAVGETNRGDRTMTLLELERSFLPLKAGELQIPASRLHFAYATRFEEDFLEGRRPVDRRDATLVAGGVDLTILPLPEENRPRGFSGAVGNFEVRAEVDEDQAAKGQSLKLSLIFEGEGNLEFFPAPALTELEQFHVYGNIDDRGMPRRTIVYDVAPLDPSVVRVPEIPFSFFDPIRVRYRTVKTDPLPLSTDPTGTAPEREDANLREEKPRRSPGDLFGPKQVTATTNRPGDGDGLKSAFLLAALGLPSILAAASATWLRRRERDRLDPKAARSRRARSRFRLQMRGGRATVEEALVGYLAAKLATSEAAIVTPDLAERLEARGISRDLAQRTGELVEGMISERYGAPITDRDALLSMELVEAIEEQLSKKESSR